MADPAADTRRRTFAPVLVLGLAAGTLAAVAGNKTWVEVEPVDRTAAFTALSPGGQVPLATALSLVVLAAWGVLLVTRGVVRRAMAVLALIAGLGVAVTVVVGGTQLPGEGRAALEDLGVTDVTVDYTGWLWAAGVGAALCVLAGLLAVRHVRQWPEMGTRYDAPGATTIEEPESNLDLWKAFDEGRDPTA